MANIEQGKTSLGDSEERLRRSLGLVGLISLDFQASMIPISFTDDSTRPGCNVFRGRHYSADIAVNAPASGGNPVAVNLRALNEIIIDEIVLSAADTALPATVASTEVTLAYLPPAAADPFTTATQSGVLTERVVAGVERPPLVIGNSVVTPFGGTNIGRLILTSTAPLFALTTRIHLPVGGKLGISFLNSTGVVATACRAFVRGRIF